MPRPAMSPIVEPDRAVVERHDLVPVAADLEPRRRGLVARREVETLDLGQGVRKQ